MVKLSCGKLGISTFMATIGSQVGASTWQIEVELISSKMIERILFILWAMNSIHPDQTEDRTLLKVKKGSQRTLEKHFPPAVLYLGTFLL